MVDVQLNKIQVLIWCHGLVVILGEFSLNFDERHPATNQDGLDAALGQYVWLHRCSMDTRKSKTDGKFRLFNTFCYIFLFYLFEKITQNWFQLYSHSNYSQ